MSPETVAEFIRWYLTEMPLVKDDVRLALVNEVRECVIKENPATHERWIVLDALRSVSMKKWRSRNR